ncbi:sensor histidine kinase [Fictibacillus phosphorivorans]|uniref:sensor histidine kinase n=1 Tax=Fictibacillus phosphorivorans TaxID=1221500 RepID=UPI00203AB84E|nr:histidine kinase [Fictibacillus phosphorivorans]MCM3719070.1 histidine kinase [Fictibacillus phosphorivorans]MCM3776692.1 histidine kinase [Fictibacillus phosphorivorans]
MTYRQIKWLILLIPTFSVGLWENARHSFLLPYISMSAGNWLSAILVFLVTLYFLNILFSRLERMQQELQRERSEKAVLEERGKIAKELHDGIAQSLFFLSVQVNKLDNDSVHHRKQLNKLKKTLQHIHDDTRSAIQNLRSNPSESDITWTKSLNTFFNDMEGQHDLKIHRNWQLTDEDFTSKDKVELFACVKEAIINVIKHAKSREVWVESELKPHGWVCRVIDKGIGFDINNVTHGFGLKILKDRAASMDWKLTLKSERGLTELVIEKEDMS